MTVPHAGETATQGMRQAAAIRCEVLGKRRNV